MSLSDSVYIPQYYNLDLIDEFWTMDHLSDDDIEISPEIDINMDDNDVESHELAKREEERWADLALEKFVPQV